MRKENQDFSFSFYFKSASNLMFALQKFLLKMTPYPSKYEEKFQDLRQKSFMFPTKLSNSAKRVCFRKCYPYEMLIGFSQSNKSNIIGTGV